MMKQHPEAVILDVREKEEYDAAHIPGSVLVPLDCVRTEACRWSEDTMFLVYCRSGRRSKIAALQLEELGFDNIYEFGGIIDWPYEIDSE